MERRVFCGTERMEESAMLVLDKMEPCERMIPNEQPDGEGGMETVWETGDAFAASIVLQNSAEYRRAENGALRKSYSVFTDKGVELQHQDVFRRCSDGKTFRVTSDGRDRQTPACASFSFVRVTAERWDLT